MQRILFTISPSYNGWELRDELRNRDWFDQCQDALIAADKMACARHELTGVPTGVMLDDRTGEPMICATHG